MTGTLPNREQGRLGCILSRPDLHGRGPMRIVALTVFLFFAGSSACFAYGTIAVGFDTYAHPSGIAKNYNHPSKADAERAAIQACTAAKYVDCSILVSFENACANVYLGGRTQAIYTGTGPDQSKASAKALDACMRDGNSVCSPQIGAGVCDGTSAMRSPSAAAPVSNQSPSAGDVLGGISHALESLFGLLIFFGAIGLGFYWLYYRWTSKEIPVPELISAEEHARTRSELKVLQEQAKRPELPPPVLPERPPSPVTGIMRVDVTQTDKTVDVFLVLSEQAKFLIEKHDLAKIPIEENLDGLQAHPEQGRGVPGRPDVGPHPYRSGARTAYPAGYGRRQSTHY